MKHYRENVWPEKMPRNDLEFWEENPASLFNCHVPASQSDAPVVLPTSELRPRGRHFHWARLILLALPVGLAVTWVWRTLQISRTAAHTIGQTMANAQAAQRFIRTEDLPLAHTSTDDLPLAPPIAVRRLLPDEVTPALVRKADEVLWTKNPPMGAEIPIEVGGSMYIARIETHFHEVGGPLRPWGYHKGVTLYAAR